MPRPVSIIAATVLALGATEGTAYWWMHPAPAGSGQPVLCYRPSRSAGVSPAPTAPPSSLSTINYQPSTTSTLTPLPDVVAKSMPSLRCSTGTAARIDREDGVTIHLAFFEWDLTDSTSVLEAFKHLPEECMGSIGMTLVSKEKPVVFTVRDQKTVGPDRRASPLVASGVGSERRSVTSSSTDHRSLITDHSLLFDHTVFRDPGGTIVHAFKGTWVSGASSLIGNGFRGGADQWRQIRWNAALKRFRPAHARVAQGAVRGLPNPELAWEAFKETMLADLKFEPSKYR